MGVETDPWVVHCVRRVGVISEPDHSEVELTPNDQFIVLASDGVWEFISSKEAVDIIAQYDTAEESCRMVRGNFSVVSIIFCKCWVLGVSVGSTLFHSTCW